MVKVKNMVVALLATLAVLVVFPLRAYAGSDYRTTYTETLRVGGSTNLKAIPPTGVIVSAAWSSSDESAVRITEGRQAVSCVVQAVAVPRNNEPVRVRCEFTYMISDGRFSKGYNSFCEYLITVTESGGSGGSGGSGDYTLSASTNSLNIDMASGGPQSITLTSGVPLSSSVLIEDDSAAGSVVSASQDSVSGCTADYRVYGNSVGKQVVTFKLVTKNGSNTTIKQKVSVKCAVTCSHNYDGGTVTKEPTPTSEGERTYTCRCCGQTKVETIKRVEGPARVKVSEESVSLVTGESKVITLTIVGTMERICKFSVSTNGTGFDASLTGTFRNKSRDMTIKGVAKGSGTVTVKLLDASSGEVLDTADVVVTVDERADAGTDDPEPGADEPESGTDGVGPGKDEGGYNDGSGEASDEPESGSGGVEPDKDEGDHHDGSGEASDGSGSGSDGVEPGKGEGDHHDGSGEASDGEAENGAKERDSVTIAVSDPTVSMAAGKSKSVTLTAKGDLPKRYRFVLSKDGSGYTASLVGTARNGSQRMTVRGTAKGTGTITVSLENRASGKVLATAEVEVEVGDRAGSARITSSPSSVKVKEGSKKRVTIIASGVLPKKYNFYASTSTSDIQIYWAGSWFARRIHPMYIVGNSECSGTVTVWIKDLSTGEAIAKTEIQVEVV